MSKRKRSKRLPSFANKGDSVSAKNSVQNGLQTQQVRQIHFSGPLPPSAELARYEETLPGAADRILKMAEEQSRHRQGLENRAIDSDIKSSNRGQIFGIILSGGICIGSFYLITIGKDILGISTLAGTLTTLVGAFIYGTVSRKRERQNKK